MLKFSFFNLVLIAYLTITQNTFAQDKNDKVTYIDSLGNETSSKKYALLRIIKDYYTEKTEYKVFDFNPDKKLTSFAIFRDKDAKINNGISINYFENGEKKHSKLYENGQLKSNDTIWDEQGYIKMIGEYFFDEDRNEVKHKILEFWNEDAEHLIKNGSGIVTFKENNIEYSGAIINGLKSGKWTGTFDDTDDTFTEMYFDGDFISGVRIDYYGKQTLYKEIEANARPVNGYNDFNHYIKNNFKYTQEALKVSGKILIKLSISSIGQITAKEIVQGIGYGMDEKVTKLILNYEGWLPAEKRGLTMDGDVIIPIIVE